MPRPSMRWWGLWTNNHNEALNCGIAYRQMVGQTWLKFEIVIQRSKIFTNSLVRHPVLFTHSISTYVHTLIKSNSSALCKSQHCNFCSSRLKIYLHCSFFEAKILHCIFIRSHLVLFLSISATNRRFIGFSLNSQRSRALLWFYFVLLLCHITDAFNLSNDNCTKNQTKAPMS